MEITQIHREHSSPIHLHRNPHWAFLTPCFMFDLTMDVAYCHAFTFLYIVIGFAFPISRVTLALDCSVTIIIAVETLSDLELRNESCCSVMVVIDIKADFNECGDWNPITDVVRDDYPFTKISEESVQGHSQSLTWGPKCSEDVDVYLLFTRVEIFMPFEATHMTFRNIPDIPQEVKVVCKYRTTSRFGAILLTVPPVTKHFFYHETPFARWFGRNASHILNKYPEVKRHDVWVITSTFSTAQCAINVWQSNQKQISVGFTESKSGNSSPEEKGIWFTAFDEGWNIFKENGHESVVFLAGLRFRYSRTRDIAKKLGVRDSKAPFKHMFRGANDEEVEFPIVNVSENEAYKISCERWETTEDSPDNENDE